MNNEFPKAEKLVSRAIIERLFSGDGSKSKSAFPIRIVYLMLDEAEADALTIDSREHLQQQVLISVPKRCFKHAVDRNHVKRQIREAYRTHRHLFTVPEGKRLFIAFIWLDNRLYSTQEVEKRVKRLMGQTLPLTPPKTPAAPFEGDFL